MFRQLLKGVNLTGKRTANSKKQTSSQLLKKATQLKRQKKIDEAVTMIQQAHQLAREKAEILSHASYLKLPQYLLLANRNDEAWALLNKMLLKGLSGQPPSKEMRWIEHSQIYSQMAKQSKQEQRYTDAAIYTTVACTCWQRALVMQGRSNEAKLDSDSTIHDAKKNLVNEPDDVVLSFVSIAEAAIAKNGKIQPSEVLRDLKAALAG